MSAAQTRHPEEFASLFRYTHWAHRRVLDALRTADDVPERTVTLFSHLLRAQDIWYGRVQGTDHADLELWADENLSACADRLTASTERWRALLEPLDAEALDRPVAYTNSKGTRFETPLRDILHHVVNHGTHHRAQIVLLLREAGIAPPATDYIFFLREE